MKLLLLLLLPVLAHSQDKSGWYVGGALGMSFQQQTVGKTTLAPTSFIFQMPVSYRFNNNILIEGAPLYAGDIIIPVQAGYAIDLGENDLTLMGGVSDYVYPSFHPIQVVHHFYGIGTARLQLGDFYLQAACTNKTYFFTIGFRGLGNTGTYK